MSETLAELEREKQRLLNEQKVKQDMDAYEEKGRTTKKEIFKLKHKRLASLGERLGGAIKGAMNAPQQSRGVRYIKVKRTKAKPTRKVRIVRKRKKKQGGPKFGLNPNFFG